MEDRRKGFYYIPIILLVLFSQSSKCQNIILSGTIVNSDYENLEFVNIIAIPQESHSTIEYDISNSKGEFDIAINRNIVYQLKISSLEYCTIIDTIKIISDTTINYVLEDKLYSLDSVIIKEKRLPIRINGDTITFNTKSFTEGDERKLGDVLNKLPGIENSEEEGLTYKGVRVSKLLVEGKLFFGGNTKLGTDNIPAHVVDEIEVIDKYSDVIFLKDMGIGDELVVNVKLKKDKDRFYFGDITSSGGFEKRYQFAPNLFYYSPKHSINSLNNLNNTLEQPLSFRDVVQFEGGNNRLFNDGAGILNDVFKNFSRFLDVFNFEERDVKFTSLNIVSDISEKSKLESYLIYSKTYDLQSGFSNSTYILDSKTAINEVKNYSSNRDNDFLLSKVKYTNNNSKNTSFNAEYKLKYEGLSFVKKQDINRQQDIIDYFGRNSSKRLSHDLRFEYLKKHSVSSATSVQLSSKHSLNMEDDSWDGNTSLLREINDSIFEVSQTINEERILFNAQASHLYSIDNKNQLSFYLNSDFSNTNFSSKNEFFFEEKSITSIEPGVFDNDIKLEVLATNFAVKYKIGSSKRNISITANTHLYKDNIRERSNGLFFTPKIEVYQEIDNVGKLVVTYNYGLKIPTVRNIVSNYYLSSSSTLIRGSLNANNNRYHNASYSFKRYSIFSDFSFEILGRFQFLSEGNIFQSNFNGFEFYKDLVPINNLGNSFSKEVKIKKRILGLNYEPNVVFKINKSAQFLNTELSDFTNTSLRVGVKITRAKRRRKKFLIKLTHALFYAQNINGLFKYSRTTAEYRQNIKLKESLLLKLENRIEFFQNTQRLNTFLPKANIGLEYKIDNKWILECYVYNLFDINQSVSSFQTDILISDSFERIQSRFGIVKLNYTL